MLGAAIRAILGAAGASGASVTPYRYFRLEAIARATAGDNCVMSEIELNINSVNQVAPMTSNVLPAPQVVTFSGESADPYEAWRAFDGVHAAGNMWLSPNTGYPHHVTIDLGVEKAIDEVIIKHVDDGNIVGAPKSYNILASTTGAFAGEEVTLASVVDVVPTSGQIDTHIS